MSDIETGSVEVYVFRSSVHPGKAPWGHVYARRFMRPFALVILPIMIGALMAVLQGFAALAFLYVGLPLAIVIASGWTFYQIASTPAELWVRPGAAAVRTIAECLIRTYKPDWKAIFELRTGADVLVLGLGDAAYALSRADWPEADAMLEILRDARNAPFNAAT